MKPHTRQFLEMAYTAMNNAYYNEVCKLDNNKCDNTALIEKLGKVLQAVGDLARMS